MVSALPSRCDSGAGRSARRLLRPLRQRAAPPPCLALRRRRRPRPPYPLPAAFAPAPLAALPPHWPGNTACAWLLDPAAAAAAQGARAAPLGEGLERYVNITLWWLDLPGKPPSACAGNALGLSVVGGGGGGGGVEGGGEGGEGGSAPLPLPGSASGAYRCGGSADGSAPLPETFTAPFSLLPHDDLLVASFNTRNNQAPQPGALERAADALAPAAIVLLQECNNAPTPFLAVLSEQWQRAPSRARAPSATQRRGLLGAAVGSIAAARRDLAARAAVAIGTGGQGTGGLCTAAQRELPGEETGAGPGAGAGAAEEGRGGWGGSRLGRRSAGLTPLVPLLSDAVFAALQGVRQCAYGGGQRGGVRAAGRSRVRIV